MKNNKKSEDEMKVTGVFFGENAESSICIAKKEIITDEERADFEEEARLKGTNVWFYLCSENQEIGSAYLK